MATVTGYGWSFQLPDAGLAPFLRHRANVTKDPITPAFGCPCWVKCKPNYTTVRQDFVAGLDMPGFGVGQNCHVESHFIICWHNKSVVPFILRYSRFGLE